MNLFNTVIAQRVFQNFNIVEAEKESLIVRSLSNSMSVISTVVSATPTMIVYAIYALVCE